jgi:hypothetical protein
MGGEVENVPCGRCWLIVGSSGIGLVAAVLVPILAPDLSAFS